MKYSMVWYNQVLLWWHSLQYRYSASHILKWLALLFRTLSRPSSFGKSFITNGGLPSTPKESHHASSSSYLWEMSPSGQSLLSDGSSTAGHFLVPSLLTLESLDKTLKCLNSYFHEIRHSSQQHIKHSVFIYISQEIHEECVPRGRSKNLKI